MVETRCSNMWFRGKPKESRLLLAQFFVNDVGVNVRAIRPRHGTNGIVNENLRESCRIKKLRKNAALPHHRRYVEGSCHAVLEFDRNLITWQRVRGNHIT